MSPQSSVAFHPAVLIVVLRWYASNKLIFRRHASKNPGGLGAEPPRSMGSNSKTFRFSNRLSCLSPRRSLLHRGFGRGSKWRGGSVVRAQETHGYGSAIMALLMCYLPLRSSSRTRRRAACVTAVSALSRRSCSRYSRTASGCAAFHRSVNNSSVLAVPRSMCVMTHSEYVR